VDFYAIFINTLQLKPKSVLNLLNPIFIFIAFICKCTDFENKKITAGIQSKLKLHLYVYEYLLQNFCFIKMYTSRKSVKTFLLKGV